MRDRRFVAVHRGGPLELGEHRLLALWAADCAEAVLELFLRVSGDLRVAEAIEVGRAWGRGDVKTGVAMKASVAAHAAARSVGDAVAVAAARAAGQAVATAHAADHSMGALLYAAKAIELSKGDAQAEVDGRLANLPAGLRGMVEEGLAPRLVSFGLVARVRIAR